MKISSILSILFLSLIINSNGTAQEKPVLDKAYKNAAVEKLSQLIIDHYVYEEVAQKTVAHLKQESRSGKFDGLNDLKGFANALTETVQAINKDKHMRIHLKRQSKAPDNSMEKKVEDMLYRFNSRRRSIAGFREVRRLEGNVGYLDLRGFAGVSWGAEVADRYMYLMASTDAIIIDLRKNGGGDPSMVQYLCSYFFDEKVHLNSLYWREGDRTDDFWTLDEVGGQKMPDVPLFVLTSSRTFSGAEEFAYNMQTRKRATLVGATTGGGANPGDILSINKELEVFLPTGAAINPITKTNWEGVGVIPEVKVQAEDALDKATELAKIAAEEFRKSNDAKNSALFIAFQKELNTYKQGASDAGIVEKLIACQKADLLSEGDINSLGYEYLITNKNGIAAEAIFRVNTLLYPESANTYDSYGEALAANGKLQEAISSYEKAVKLAEAKKDGNLNLFKKNLMKVKAMTSQK